MTHCCDPVIMVMLMSVKKYFIETPFIFQTIINHKESCFPRKFNFKLFDKGLSVKFLYYERQSL